MKTTERRKRYVKLNITVPPNVAEWLRGTGNYSAYLTTIVGERWRQWNTALDQLTAAGWSQRHILAACEALRGTLLGDQFLRQRVSGALRDAIESDELDKFVNDFDIDANEWFARADNLSDGTAHQLVTCARERECVNKAFDRALDQLATAEREAEADRARQEAREAEAERARQEAGEAEAERLREQAELLREQERDVQADRARQEALRRAAPKRKRGRPRGLAK